MTTSPAHKAPASRRMPSAGPVSRWLACLGLGYVVMLTSSIGGLVWLAAIHLTGMRHDAALTLSLLAGAGTFARARQLVARAAVSAREDADEPEADR